MAFRKSADEGGRGRQRYGGDRREGFDRDQGNGLRASRPEKGGKPYAYGNDKPRREKAGKLMTPASVQLEEKEPDELPFLIFGRNAVKEAVKAGRSIDKILVQTEPDGSLREIVALAKDARIIVHEVNRKKLDEVCLPFGHGGKTANHQGIVAYTAGVE